MGGSVSHLRLQHRNYTSNIFIRLIVVGIVIVAIFTNRVRAINYMNITDTVNLLFASFSDLISTALPKPLLKRGGV